MNNNQIKVSNKSKKRILDTPMQAFCDIVGKFECYDSPPEMWTTDEKERWDLLQEFEILISNKLISIIK